MYFLVYRRDTKTLESVGTDVAPRAVLDAAGLDYVTQDDRPDLGTHLWDAATLSLVPRPPETHTIISRQMFMDRLGDECVVGVEYMANGTSLDAAKLRAWLLRFHVVKDVDLSDPRTIAGVDAMIASGLLSPLRRDLVLAPAASAVARE